MATDNAHPAPKRGCCCTTGSRKLKAGWHCAQTSAGHVACAHAAPRVVPWQRAPSPGTTSTRTASTVRHVLLQAAASLRLGGTEPRPPGQLACARCLRLSSSLTMSPGTTSAVHVRAQNVGVLQAVTSLRLGGIEPRSPGQTRVRASSALALVVALGVAQVRLGGLLQAPKPSSRCFACTSKAAASLQRCVSFHCLFFTLQPRLKGWRYGIVDSAHFKGCRVCLCSPRTALHAISKCIACFFIFF